MKLIEDIGFDTSFSFVYSARPGTPAAELPDNTDEEKKKQRLQILQARINQHAQEISRRMVGSTREILVTGISKKDPGQLQTKDFHATPDRRFCSPESWFLLLKDPGQLQGRTENNRAVNFSSSDHGLIGEFVHVDIVEALPNSLRGRLRDS